MHFEVQEMKLIPIAGRLEQYDQPELLQRSLKDLSELLPVLPGCLWALSYLARLSYLQTPVQHFLLKQLQLVVPVLCLHLFEPFVQPMSPTSFGLPSHWGPPSLETCQTDAVASTPPCLRPVQGRAGSTLRCVGETLRWYQKCSMKMVDSHASSKCQEVRHWMGTSCGLAGPQRRLGPGCCGCLSSPEANSRHSLQ